MNKKNSATKTISPNWSGTGDDLFDTIQVLTNREIHDGYFETDIVFKFSDTFKYPLVFEIKSSDSVVESITIAFNIPKRDKTKWAIEERIIVPEVCEAITREDFIKYFADIDIVERDGNFVVYIDKKPTEYEKLTFHILTDGQKVVFNEHLLMALIKVLDERKEMI
jgi:hypothetical protein